MDLILIVGALLYLFYWGLTASAKNIPFQNIREYGE